MAKKLTITPGLDLETDDSISRADFTFWFTQALFAGIDRDHFASGSAPVVSSASEPTSPTTGLVWHNQSTGAVSVWTGSEWLGIGLHIGATAPTSTAPMWADTTLNIVRRYWTIDGIEGWHPVDSAYQLMVNRSGGVVEANRVVTRGTASTSGEREFDTTDTVKSQAVIGVTLESVASTASGVVAMVSGGATVDILADDDALDGAIAKGDGLVTYSIAGECRTVGPLPGAAHGSGSFQATAHIGTPLGCFAEALGTKDNVTHLVRARLLGRVGAGACVFVPDDTIKLLETSESATTTWADVDLNVPGTGTLFRDSKHSPACAVEFDVQLESTTGGSPGYESNTLSVSNSRSLSGDIAVQARGYMAGSGNVNTFHQDVVIPTVNNTTTPTAIGNLFAWQLGVYGAGTALGIDFIPRRYWY